MIYMPKPGTGRIDTHVHFRDEEQAYKETVAHGLQLATEQGIDIVCDMPNTVRPVTNRERVYERLALVPEDEKGRYFLWVGVTGNPDQIVEAKWCYDNIPEVVGFKHFAGPSVGDLNNTDPDDQRTVWRVSADIGYDGPISNHCEDDDEIDKTPDGKQKWDPANPITHCWARGKLAEKKSVYNQCRYAIRAGFKGLVHIAHISTGDSVHALEFARTNGLRVSCEVTPHHSMFNNTWMEREDGLLYKMNPPLRCSRDVRKLNQAIKQGKIDCIGTDHAPHTDEEKLNPPYMSGYPAMEIYSHFVDSFLPDELGLTPEQIKAMTCDNPRKLFEKLP